MLPSRTKTQRTKPESTQHCCPLCNEPIIGQSSQRCPHCNSLHHQCCWDYLNGCAIYACTSRAWSPARHENILREVKKNVQSWLTINEFQWWLQTASSTILLGLMFVTANVLPHLPTLSKAKMVLYAGLPLKIFLAATFLAIVLSLLRLLLHGPAIALRKLIENDLEGEVGKLGGGKNEFERRHCENSEDKDNVPALVRVTALSLSLTSIWVSSDFFAMDVHLGSGLWMFALFFGYFYQRKLINERRAYQSYFAGLFNRVQSSKDFHEKRLPTTGAVNEPLPSAAKNKEGRCPVCGCQVEKSDASLCCPRCSTPHHRECWDYTGGCAIFGCSKRGWQGRFDPVIFSKIRAMAERWQALFRRQWIAFGVAVFSLLIAVLGKIVPLGRFSTIFFVLGVLATVISVVVYFFATPKTLLLQRSLERELQTSLEPPQNQARAVIARLSTPSIDDALVITVRLVIVFSLLLTVLLPVVTSVTLKEIIVLFIAGVLIPQGSLISSQRRQKYLQSVRNRLMATFNVYKKDKAAQPEKTGKVG